MRFIPSLLLIVCLAACQRGGNNTEAVRQGVIDHLSKNGYNVAGMDIKINDVKFNGEQADATVAVTAKGQSGGAPMVLPYHLERQSSKWVVVKRSDGTNPHGGAMPPAAPGAENPHGGGAMPPAGGAAPSAGGAGQLPSPQDLPPATKK